jgi:hypothetical protein
MATVNQNQEQDQNQQPGGPTPISGTAGASASAGQGAGNAAGASPVAENTAPQANTGYTDVGSYLDANKSGSQQLGQQVAGNLTNQYNQTQSGIAQSANDVINQANMGYTKSNEQLVNQVAANPEAAATSPEQTSAFQSQLNDVYGGPNSWGDFGTQQGNVATAQQYAGLTKTPGGLNVYAQQLEGPQASQGVNQLDTMLLGGSPEAMQTVQSAADPYATLTNYLDQQNQAAQGAIKQGQTEAPAAAQYAKEQVGGLANTFNTGLGERLSAAQQAAMSQNQTLKDALMSENLTPEQLQSLGMTQDQWAALQGQLNLVQKPQEVQSSTGRNAATTGIADIQLPSWLQQQDPYAAITQANMATAPEYARSQALQTLLGNQYNPLLSQENAAQAGTAPANLNQFNYNEALQNTTQTAQAQQAAAKAYIDAIEQGMDEAHAQAQAANAQKNVAMAAGTAAMNMPLGATAATVAGGVGAGKDVAQQYSSPTQAGISTAANIASGGLYTPAKAIYSGAKSAVNTIVKAVSCFAPGSMVEMADGEEKPIQYIKVGDETRGGRVTLTLIGESSNLYDYKGVAVVGGHIVKEPKWIEVQDSSAAKKLDFKEPIQVYCICTEDHSIWINGIEFSDAVSLAWFHLNFLKHDQAEAKAMLQNLAERKA